MHPIFRTLAVACIAKSGRCVLEAPVGGRQGLSTSPSTSILGFSPGLAGCRLDARVRVVSGPLLSLRGVSLGLDAGGVRGVSLDLEAGEVGVVFGGRDAGKTTLLRLAGGMLDPDAGQVLLRGRDLRVPGDAERSRLLAGQVAWACRTGPGGLPVSMLEYVSLPLLSVAGVEREEAGKRAREALERLGVHECAEMSWMDLSAWERVGVELAQAVARRPALLFVDGLIDGLSMTAVRDAMRVIRGLAEDDGLGVLIAADDIETAVLADRLWRVEGGELLELGGGQADAAFESDRWRRRAS